MYLFELENHQLQAILVPFEQHPQSWTRVDQILERSQNNFTKQLALNILNEMVKKRWNTVPQQPREAIRSYIVRHVIRMSQSPDTLKNRESSQLLKRMNLTLVEVSLIYQFSYPTQHFLSYRS